MWFFKIIETLLKVLVNMFEEMIHLIVHVGEVSLHRERKFIFHADFSSPGKILRKRNIGFCLDGIRRLSIRLSFLHVLITGGSGVGKTSRICLPTLYSMHGSFVIHDPSGELYEKSAGHLAYRGYTVKVINFAKPEGDGFNPLMRAKSQSDIQKIASMIVNTSLGKSSGGDSFWNISSEALLTILISIVKEQPEQYQNLANVRHLLNLLGGDPEKVDVLFSKTPNEALFNEYRSFVANDQKLVSNILATTKAALQIFGDEAVAQVTSVDSIDMEEFRKRPTALFLRNNTADARYYSVLTSMFLEQFFGFLMSGLPKKKDLPITFLIDEASSLLIPSLAVSIVNLRKYRSSIMLVLQSLQQLRQAYGPANSETIIENCFSKVFFTGQSLVTARMLEMTLGKYEYEDLDKKKRVRPLMTADEIRTMALDEALLLCGHHPPMKLHLRPYYQSRMRKYAKMAPPVLARTVPEVVPLLFQSNEAQTANTVSS